MKHQVALEWPNNHFWSFRSFRTGRHDRSNWYLLNKMKIQSDMKMTCLFLPPHGTAWSQSYCRYCFCCNSSFALLGERTTNQNRSEQRTPTSKLKNGEKKNVDKQQRDTSKHFQLQTVAIIQITARASWIATVTINVESASCKEHAEWHSHSIVSDTAEHRGRQAVDAAPHSWLSAEPLIPISCVVSHLFIQPKKMIHRQ